MSFFKRIFSFAMAVLCVALLISGCAVDGGEPPARYGPHAGAALAADGASQKWQSVTPNATDQFIVDRTTDPMTFTYWYGAADTPDYTQDGSYDYKGEIVGEVAAGPSLLQSRWGYLIIKVTSSGNANYFTANKYIAAHWKNLSAAEVEIATVPYKAGGANSGKDTPEQAASEYTIENGYFGMYGKHTKR